MSFHLWIVIEVRRNSFVVEDTAHADEHEGRPLHVVGLQAWNDSTLCDVATAYATGTGQGAGRTDADLAHGARLYLPLGETISNEVVVLECDIYSQGNYDFGWNLVTLFDSVNSRWLEVGFGTANFPDQLKRVYFEWNDNKLNLADITSKREVTGGFNTIHIIQTFDLAAKNVELEWYNVLTPATSGGWTATYANDFAPDLVRLLLKADPQGDDKGYDNLSVYRVPPPPPPSGTAIVLR